MSVQRGRIAERAYDLWERRGKPEGSPEIDWSAAEQEMLGDANDPAQAKATLDPLQQQAADVLTSDFDKGPIASNTAATLPDSAIRRRSRSGRNAARREPDEPLGE